jgi:hypothetical protein
MTVADLAARLDMDWHQAARLIDPRRTSKLTSLAAALGALNCQIRLSVYDPDEVDERLSRWRSVVRAVRSRSEGDEAKVPERSSEGPSSG